MRADEYLAELAATPVRKRRSQPEHALQIRCRLFVRACVASPHVFLAFDRTHNRGTQHIQEAARGIRSGTPDTVVIAFGRVIWIEIKAPGQKPNDNQQIVGEEIRKAGGIWEWTDSVMGYAEHLDRHNIPLRAHWRVIAEDYDLQLAAARAKVPKAKRQSKPYRPKPSTGRIARVNAIRKGLL